jgi:anti-sigma factor RsiW
MRCTKAAYQLQLYIDHQLTLRQTRVLEAHVASCPSCRAELNLLEEVACGLNTLRFVSEPANMHEQIMQRVAMTASRAQVQQREKQAAHFKLFRPSLTEILIASLLATIATLATLLKQSSPRVWLPTASGHDPFSLFYTQAVHMLTSIDANTLIVALWIVGTLLGVCITLAVAGSEMRTQWFKAMMERLPVR